jgi:hypothetical protein
LNADVATIFGGRRGRNVSPLHRFRDDPKGSDWEGPSWCQASAKFVLRAASMGALALVAFAGAPIVLAPLLAALSTAAGAAYPQCVAAVLPRLVGAGDLAANAARISIKGPASSPGPPSAPRCSS